MRGRWLKVYTDPERLPSVLAAFEEEGVEPRVWSGDAGRLVEALVPPDRLDRVLARLRMGLGPGDRAVVLPVELAIPGEEEPPPAKTPLEALGGTLEEGSRLGGLYLLLVALSALVAFFGLVRDDAILLIASMITSPLMTPLVALAFASSWRDPPLLRRALVSSLAGFALALVLGFLLGLVYPAEPTPAMLNRAAPNPADLVLALAAGTMAALSFVAGRGDALIGVMVAIALLPPAVNAGVMLAWGRGLASAGSLLLLAVNAAAILLSSSLTFAFAFRFSLRRALPAALLWAALALALYWFKTALG